MQAAIGTGMAIYFGFVLYLLGNGLSSRLQESGAMRPAEAGGAYQPLPEECAGPQEDGLVRTNQQEHCVSEQQTGGGKSGADHPPIIGPYQLLQGSDEAESQQQQLQQQQ